MTTIPAPPTTNENSNGKDMSLSTTTTTTPTTTGVVDQRNPLSSSQVSTSSTAAASNVTNPIRHAGRALVRGKFRRVWRPRYLEVRDNGLLSYYECPPLTPTTTTTTATTTSSALDVFVVDPTTTTVQTESHSEAATTTATTLMEADHGEQQQQQQLQDQYCHSKIPKCTLYIHHARVIDPTTLRDMHVGLPRGAYGFLFHGHRIDFDEGEEGNDLLQDGLQLLNMGQACQGGNTTDATSRDFLCAVDSLEEAQSWVVALQWAASMGRDSTSFHHHSASSGGAGAGAGAGAPPLPYRMPLNDVVAAWDHQDGLSVSSSPFGATSPNQRQQQQQQQQQQPSPSPIKSPTSPNRSGGASGGRSTTTTPSKQLLKQSPSRPPPNSASNSNNSSAGKMVVTKVVGYTLVRLEMWKWEIAYQIQVLLVMPTKEQRQVQEWSILRTAQNLELIVDKLKVSLPPTTCQRLNPQIERIGSLPKLYTAGGGAPPLAELLSNSVAVMDSILRSFCMEATVVNSSVMKRFLGVHPATTNNQQTMVATVTPQQQQQQQQSSSSPFWEIHNSTGLWTRPQSTILHHQSIDQYVKQWLQKRPKDQTTTTPSFKFRFLCWYLSRLPQPATTYGGIILLTLGLSVCTLPTINQFIAKFQILPYITMRLDALILSWCLAAGIGNLLGASSPPRATASSSSSSACPTISRPSATAAATAVITKSGSFGGAATAQQTPIKTSLSSASAPTTPQGSPAKSSLAARSKEAAALRVTNTPNRSLMDEDDSQDLMGEGEDDGNEEEDDGMNEAAATTAKATSNNSPSLPDLAAEADRAGDDDDDDEEAKSFLLTKQDSRLSSPLPQYSTADQVTESCWSTPKDHIFHVRGPNYLTDRVKIPSGDASFTCQGVDMWMTDNPERHIARHPSVMGGQLANMDQDVFLVNFLLPFGNFVSYFAIPPLEKFANPQLAGVWTRFIQGDQQYRDARLKLLPVVVDGPWIVRAAVPGTSPALLGKVIPLQYFFTQKPNGRSIYEVDVIITASSIAKGILSVVKGHAKALSIAFAFIIEAAEEHELPETVLASFQVNSLHLEDCPLLPYCNLDSF